MIDKSCVQQVLGSLMHHPQFLSQVDKYSLSIEDFNNRFEKYIFQAIKGLYEHGAAEIAPIDIANFLEVSSTASTVLKQNNGIEYLNDILEFSNWENFSYYYDKLKKFNLLRDYKKAGINVDEFYIDDAFNDKAEEVNKKFEQLTIQDIVEQVKKKLLAIESNYAATDEVITESVSENILDFIQDMNETLDVGMPIQGKIYNQVIGGARKGTLTIRSAGSGVGKTRSAVADACYLAYPIRYNPDKKEWEQSGSSEKVLFIVTEQNFKEVKKMILAYLTGINESRFKFGSFDGEELLLLNQAAEIIKHYEENFILLKMPNPTIDLVKMMIRQECLMKNIEYVFYDYIFIGPALLNEFKGFNLRNDEVLLMFATALKDLAVELNVALFTSTQVNASADDNKNIRNEASLAGGRATINKADNGAIMARPSPEELEILKQSISMFGTPDLVTDIFKVRSGEWTQVRIWSQFDRGTLRRKDLFITDARFEAVSGFFEDPNCEVTNWDEQDTEEIIQELRMLNDAIRRNN